MNEKTRALQARLIKTVQALSRRLGRTTDPEEAEAILQEMEAVNFRVVMAGRLLFRRTTDSLERRVDSILEEADELDQSIRQIDEIKRLARVVGSFLTLVDKALNAIRVLA